MRQVNKLVVCKEDYDKNEEKFRKALSDALMVILNNGYECTVRYDEPGFGIVVFEYDYDRAKGFGNPLPYWLSDDEADSVTWDDECNSAPKTDDDCDYYN